MDNIFFKDDDLEVGGETDAYCPSCKTDTLHTVVTMFEGELRSVQCTICNATHAFRPPRGEAEDEMPEPIAVRRRQSLRKRPWADVVAGVTLDAAPIYSPREQYIEGQILRHPVFGLGYISELVTDTKLEGTFKDGPRILVHNRPDLVPPDDLPKRKAVRAAVSAKLAKKVAETRAKSARAVKAAAKPAARKEEKKTAAASTKVRGERRTAAASPKPAAQKAPARKTAAGKASTKPSATTKRPAPAKSPKRARGEGKATPPGGRSGSRGSRTAGTMRASRRG